MEALFEALFGSFKSEWRVVTAAPGLFFMAVALVAIAIWVVVKAHYKERLETYQATIEHKDSVLGEYKDRLNGATPLEVAREIESLKAQVVRLTGKVERPQRRLTPAQREGLIEKLRDHVELTGMPVRISSTPDTESARFATELTRGFRAAGLQVDQNTFGKHDEGERGLILYRAAEIIGPKQQALADILLELGIAHVCEIDPDAQYEYLFVCPESD